MITAVVGSRNIIVKNIEKFIPKEASTIISGGAKGVDTCAKEYAQKNNIDFLEILPQYSIYGKAAPIKRNNEIVEKSDFVIAFWDGKSRGTKYVIDLCRKKGKAIQVYLLDKDGAGFCLIK